jgi:solute carrier family 8 (sodium/calcium exchanger)
VGTRNWAQQFWNAIFQVGDDDDEEDDGEEEGENSGPSYHDYAIHIVSIPWKLLFAFVPPVDYCGGWACFFGALVMIAVVTALVSDMANLVGCCLDILPETCAITFVALGTSLPDTFASMTAAMMDPYADASIGNVTGSNSINVFMGIGLAWSLAAFKWQIGEPNDTWMKGFSQLTDDAKKNVVDFLDNDPTKAVFITPAGSIWFNLMVFSLNALCAVWHLAARRAKYGGELGGPKKAQYFSAVFLIGQWFLYIIASIVFSRTVAEPLTYTQIAELDNA